MRPLRPPLLLEDGARDSRIGASIQAKPAAANVIDLPCRLK